MSMTKKDYTQIAAVIKRYRKPFTSFDVEYTGEDDYVDFVHDLCVIFEENNSRFDSDRFKEAVGVI